MLLGGPHKLSLPALPGEFCTLRDETGAITVPGDARGRVVFEHLYAGGYYFSRVGGKETLFTVGEGRPYCDTETPTRG